MHVQSIYYVKATLTLSPPPATTVDKTRHPGLTPQVTIVDNVPSAQVSTKVDIYCMLVKLTTYCILMGCGKLRTVVYFQKINRWQKS